MEYKGEHIETSITCFFNLEEDFNKITELVHKIDINSIDTCGECINETTRVRKYLSSLINLTDCLPEHNSKALKCFCCKLMSILDEIESYLYKSFGLEESQNKNRDRVRPYGGFSRHY